jgi:hypothetical protein
VTIEFNEIPGWQFKIEEISAGVYEASGKDKSGRNVKKMGSEPDKLLEYCKNYAMQFISI